MRFAALDIGTVTCRLLVADVIEGQLVELDRRVAITNLGVGVDSSGFLRDDAIDRVVSQLSAYKSIIDSYAVGCDVKVTAVATSAARDAANSQVLVDRLEDIGIHLNIIEGTREAGLSFKGASAAFAGENVLVVDIGGGSTEVIFGIGGGDPAFSHSFNIGCRRITERFLHSDPPTAEECHAAQLWVRETMTPIFAQATDTGLAVDRIVAVAGTATTTVSVDKAMVEYDPAQVDGVVISRNTLLGIYDQLREMPLDDRKQVVGLEPQRASVIVAGLGVLLCVLDCAGKRDYTVSESDILQGIIMDSYEANS